MIAGKSISVANPHDHECITIERPVIIIYISDVRTKTRNKGRRVDHQNTGRM